MNDGGSANSEGGAVRGILEQVCDIICDGPENVVLAARRLKAENERLWLDVLRTQKDVKGGMKVGPLPYYCPFCSWDEKSQVALAKHMGEKHAVVMRGLKGTT